MNPGFDPHNVLTFDVSLPDSYSEGASAAPWRWGWRRSGCMERSRNWWRSGGTKWA